MYENTTWLHDGIQKRTCEIVLRHVDHAFKSFFNGYTRHPKFKSKKYSKQSFEVRNEPNAFYFKGTKVRISGLPFGDMIECKNHIIPTSEESSIRYYRCTITFDGVYYWLSVNTEVDKSYLKNHDETEYTGKTIGIDLGIRKLAVLSTGQVYKLPVKKINKLVKRNNRQHRRLSKMKNARTKHNISPSKNEERLRFEEYKTRKRIQNIKHTFIHQMTTEIANMYPDKIVMEDLSVSTLKKMPWFSKNNPGVFYDIRTIMKYKCEDRGIEFVLANCNFPSSQICSRCGNMIPKSSSEIVKCKHCGLVIDRDLNAAINLSKYTIV